METVVEVMVVADMFLVPGLKRQCGVYLGTRLQTHTVVSTLRLARLFQLSRLEDQCIAFMAKHLDQVK